MNVKIKEIPLNDRPRERLINKGSSNLSDEELLAIILKTGTKDISAKSVASNLLKQTKNIKNLKDITLEKLTTIKGIGIAKACELLAVIELGNRIYQTYETISQITITSADNIFNYYKHKIGSKKQEHFICICLDTKNHIIKDNLLYIGTLNQSIIHPREIFKSVYLCSASGIILIHNHPSGITDPSEEDIKITNQLVEVGKLLGIRVLDHIIICQNDYFSFKENGLL